MGLNDIGTWTVIESDSHAISEMAGDRPVTLERILKNRHSEFRHELISEFTHAASLLSMQDRDSSAGVRLELADKVAPEKISQDDWFWRVTLRFDSNRPAATTVRPARMALSGDILKSLLEHWRKPL